MVVGVRTTRRADPSGRPVRPHAGGQRLPEPAEPPGGLVAGRRIRDDVRDGAYVMAFTAVASTGTAVLIVLLSRLAG